MEAGKRKRESREILGIEESADEETLKRAYHRLAKEYHPDRPNNKGRKEEADRMFQKVKEAYDNLSGSTATLNLLKNTFKCTKTSSAVEQFLNSSGKLGNFSPMRAEDFHNSNSFVNSTTSTTTLSGHFNLGSVNPNLLNQLGPKFHNVINNTSSPLMQPRPQPKRGQSLQTTLTVTFRESVYGCNKTIEFSRGLICTQCNGAGSTISKFSSSNSPSVGGSPTQGSTSCRDCSGRGVLMAKIGGSNVSTTCTTCNGAGSQENPSHGDSGVGVSGRGLGCPCCSGAGKLNSRKTCTIVVPPGVVTDSQQILDGEGDEGTDGGASGDLILCFKVEPHPFYQRRGDDVISKINVSFPQLILGGRVQIYSIYGNTLVVDVPPLSVQPMAQSETAKHQIVKIANEGYPRSEGRGNMYVQISSEMPANITDEEKEILEKLTLSQNFAPRRLFGEPMK